MSPTHTAPWLKKLLGELPWTAELYERVGLRDGPPTGGYRLTELERRLPEWVEALHGAPRKILHQGGKRVLVVGHLSWWVENTVALALLLRRAGHEPYLAFLPYRRWWTRQTKFDTRRQQAYLRTVLDKAEPWLRPVDLLGLPATRIPDRLERSLERQSLLDLQYTLQREDVSPQSGGEESDLYQLRSVRNRAAASRALGPLRRGSFDVVVIPNGSILEFGALRRTAQFASTRVTTYEYGEQRNRAWLAQDGEVMRLNTDPLWEARGDAPLTGEEQARLEALYKARRGGEAWRTFARQWQAAESRGAQAARQELDLDPNKPVVLLCTNVVADSLALDRQMFTEGMADWLETTVQHFADLPQAQLVVRVHPGELKGAGHPSVEIVRQAAPDLPDHVVVVPPESELNTYDLIELAQLGLVYTTTVGMEMAMSGVPVIVAGATHYRGKGFTHEPGSLQEYLDTLDRLLKGVPGRRLPEEQVKLARRYAYRFFFEYPFPYPWHVIDFWQDMERRPFAEVIGEGRFEEYHPTLEALVGEPIDWSRRAQTVAEKVAG